MANFVEILSIAVAAPMLLLCYIVVSQWLPPAREALRHDRNAASWVILGVAVAFGGLALNTIWWTGYWIARTSQLESPIMLLRWGAAVNLLTKHGTLLLSAWCFIKAHSIVSGKNPKEPVIYALVSAVLILAVLIYFTLITPYRIPQT